MKNKILKRHRVESALDRILDYPLTIVTATIGYGKTTAVKEWLKNKSIKTVWLSLCEDDILEDIVWNRFVLAWEKTFQEKYNLRGLNGFPRDIHQVSDFVDVLIAATANEHVILVCDDYQFVDANPKIRKITEQVAQEEINNFHIVLISRHLTQLNSALLTAKGLCYVIGTDTLAFTNEEVTDYFNLNGLYMDATALSRVKKFAEGWTAALVLTQMNAQQNTSIPVLDMDHLMSECFNSLFDEKSRILLAKLSFLEKFTMPEAIYILETREIIGVLNLGLERNAFVYFDPKTEYYRMHILTRTFLQKMAKNTSIDLSRVKYLTGVWLLEHGELNEAVKYYLDMNNSLELISRLNELEELGALYSVNTELLYKLCTSLPIDTCLKYPFPYLHMFLNFSFCGNSNMVNLANSIFNTIEKHFGNISDDQSTHILGELEILKSAINFTDIYKVVEHVNKALAFFNGEYSRVSYKRDTTTFGIPIFSYIYFKQAGDFKHLGEFLTTEFVPLLLEHNGMYGTDQLVTAEYELETGNFDAAHIAAQKSIYIALNKGFTCIAICATFTLARYYLIDNKPARALEKISKIRHSLLTHRPEMTADSNAVYNTTIDLCEAYIHACLGTSNNIPNWIKKGDISGGYFMVGDLGFMNIIRSKCLVLEERWLELEALSATFESAYLTYHNQIGLLHNKIYLAIARYHLYGMHRGVTELLTALEEGAKDHIICLFAENARHLLPMLNQIHSSKKINSEYFNKLFAAALKYENMLNNFGQNKNIEKPIVFTDRELEVLRLLQHGLMGKEIADKLCLSLIAVKKHLSNVYKKLGVTHKGAAIKRLHDLKIK